MFTKILGVHSCDHQKNQNIVILSFLFLLFLLFLRCHPELPNG